MGNERRKRLPIPLPASQSKPLQAKRDSDLKKKQNLIRCDGKHRCALIHMSTFDLALVPYAYTCLCCVNVCATHAILAFSIVHPRSGIPAREVKSPFCAAC